MQAPWSTVVIIERKNQTFRGTPSDPSVNIKLHTATADDRRCSYFQSIMTAFHDCQKHFKHLHATWHVSERLQTYHKHAMQSETFSDHHKWVSKQFQQIQHPTQKSSGDGEHDCKPCSCSKCRIDSSINSRFELIFGQNASRWDQRGLKQHQVPCESTIGYKIFSTFQRWSKMHGIPVWIQQIASYHTMRNSTTLQSSWRSNAVLFPSFTSCGKFSNQKHRSKVCLET